MKPKISITVTEDEESVTVERDGKRYIVFFDQEEDFAVVVENGKMNSHARVELPTVPGGCAVVRYWEKW